MAEPQVFLDGRVTLHCGDCLDVLAVMPENSVDSVVCDPPYHLHSIVKRFAKTGRTESTATKSGPHQRTATGFMGKRWDGGDIAFRVETWEAVCRVLKPGGYVVAFSSSRTFGRMSVAIEDAGFITHPMFGWIFGSGFPKAHNAAKAIDRELGAQGVTVPAGAPVRRIRPGADQHKDGSWEKLEDREYQPGSYMPGSPEAERWMGFAYGGQATKPALEPIYVGQKPFSEKNGAANILKYGTGALNIDGCRVDGNPRAWGTNTESEGYRLHKRGGGVFPPSVTGRWPANIIHDGSEEVLAGFPDSQSTIGRPRGAASGEGTGAEYADSGSAARFFYTAKADSEDRLGSKHPTVKPLDLMQYLCRLVTPPGGTILDCFAGTGTTGEAAWREGFRAILIEREAEYHADIERRMDLVLKPTKRAAVAKSKNKLMGAEGTPLFPETAA